MCVVTVCHPTWGFNNLYIRCFDDSFAYLPFALEFDLVFLPHCVAEFHTGVARIPETEQEFPAPVMMSPPNVSDDENE